MNYYLRNSVTQLKVTLDEVVSVLSMRADSAYPTVTGKFVQQDSEYLGSPYETTSLFDGVYDISAGVNRYGHRMYNTVYVFDGIIYPTKEAVSYMLEEAGFKYSDFF